MKDVEINGKKYKSIPTKATGRTYTCDNCVAKDNMGLCQALPDCTYPYIHFVEVN